MWTHQYASRLCSAFLGYVGFQMLVPTLTTHVRQIGASHLGTSLVYSLAALAALLARALFGNRLDTLGRKPLLLIGAGMMIVVNLALFRVTNIALIGTLRFIQGFGWGLASTALATLMSDIIPGERLGEGIGYFSMCIVLATSLSIILGIDLMNRFGFVATLGFSTVTFGGFYLLGQRTPATSFVRAQPGAERPGLLATLFEPSALLPATLCFLHSLAFSGIMAFIMLFGIERGIQGVGVFFIGHLAMIVASRPVVGKLFDRRGHAIIVLPGVVSMIAGLLLLSMARSAPLLILASIFYGLGYGTVQPSLQAWAVQRSPQARKGAANGTFMSSIDLGYAIGTVLMGAIAGVSSYAFMYRLSVLPLLVLLVIYGAFLASHREEWAFSAGLSAHPVEDSGSVQ
ncbi:MAG: MFS transporter [Holophaga sp.]|nr:MFS transporter [Holophaga sp.]